MFQEAAQGGDLIRFAGISQRPKIVRSILLCRVIPQTMPAFHLCPVDQDVTPGTSCDKDNVTYALQTRTCRKWTLIHVSRHHPDDSILKEFGNALRRERIKRGMTREAAAAAVDIDRAAWNFMEHARRNVSIVTAARAAKALGLTLGELLASKKKR